MFRSTRIAIIAFSMLSIFSMADWASARTHAFVWANNPTAASYVPSSSYQYNLTGLDNEIERLSRGRYKVRMPLVHSLSTGGNVQVSAYGTGTQRCKTWGWGRVAVTLEIQVRCFDTAGRPVDAQFTALYHDQDPHAADVAFAWSNELSPAPGWYQPSAFWRHNPGLPDPLGPLGIRRISRGVYQVRISGWPDPDRGFLVTSYGSDSAYCNIYDDDHERAWVHDEGWTQSMVLDVRCYDSRGYLQDSRFTFAMAQERGFGSPNVTAAYALSDRPTASSANAAPETSWNSQTSVAPVTIREGRGRYSVYFLGTPGTYDKSTALVTAKSLSGNYCNVASWGDSSFFTKVNVRCYTPSGARSDSEFFVSFLTGE